MTPTKLSVCYKAGISPYPCDSLPKLRKEHGWGDWLCDEHFFQAEQAWAAQETKKSVWRNRLLAGEDAETQAEKDWRDRQP